MNDTRQAVLVGTRTIRFEVSSGTDARRFFTDMDDAITYYFHLADKRGTASMLGMDETGRVSPLLYSAG